MSKWSASATDEQLDLVADFLESPFERVQRGDLLVSRLGGPDTPDDQPNAEQILVFEELPPLAEMLDGRKIAHRREKVVWHAPRSEVEELVENRGTR